MAPGMSILCLYFLPVCFALRAPSLAAVDNSALMLVSGTTSLSEYCVAVESGLTGSSGAALVLEPCTSAVAAGDGRELWSIGPTGQLRNLACEKCAVVASNDTSASLAPRVVLGDCAGFAEEAGRWEVLEQGQIRFGKDGLEPRCLSQRGAAPERKNVALGAAAAASSTLDTSEHGAALAVDGSHSTYWVSEVGVTDPVTLRIDFGNLEKLLSLNIVWEFPAQDFSVALVDDSGQWVQVFGTDTNFAKKSFVRLGSKPATALRLSMRAPHIMHGYVDGQGVYGIRSLEALAWGMYSVLDACGIAARGDDARDTYFPIHAAGYDLSSADALRSELPSLAVASSSLAAAISQINLLHSRVAECTGDLAEHDKDANSYLRRHSHNQTTLRKRRGEMGANASLADFELQLEDARDLMDQQHGIGRSVLDDLLYEAREAIVGIRAALL